MADNKLTPIVCGRTEFNWGERTYIMGVCNVTPDSFSGDGLADNIEAAVALSRKLVDDGADIIDVGGESTHPRAMPVSVEEELRRVIPVIQKLSSVLAVPISIDTCKAEVARSAIEAGAGIINDVRGLSQSPELAAVAAEKGIPLILVSNQRGLPHTGDIITTVISSLRESINTAVTAGVPFSSIIIDPGIGFGKSLEENLEIIRRLAELKILERPVLLGTSRKLMVSRELDSDPAQRMESTAATVAIGIANGADVVRVHDVKYMLPVCRMSDAIIRRRLIRDRTSSSISQPGL